MFGYVTVYKPELKIKDYYKYRAYYCGLCRRLQHCYGFAGQMTLSYDMTFVVMLLTALYECETRREDHRCKARPLKKSPVLINEITNYAADMNVVLSYYHLMDDWHDERSIRGLAGAAALRRKVRGVERKYPRQCHKIRGGLQRLSALEARDCQDIDDTAGCFGSLMSELLVYREDIWAPYLRRIGFFLGKFIYIMDAVDDIERDLKNGNFNPLRDLHARLTRKDFMDTCYQMLTMMISEVSASFECLPCLQDVDILRNILYLGVWNQFRRLEEKQREADGSGSGIKKRRQMQ